MGAQLDIITLERVEVLETTTLLRFMARQIIIRVALAPTPLQKVLLIPAYS
jgi:hypothetical protein